MTRAQKQRFLDDPESSLGAWFVSVCLKILVFSCVAFSFFQTTQRLGCSSLFFVVVRRFHVFDIARSATSFLQGRPFEQQET